MTYAIYEVYRFLLKIYNLPIKQIPFHAPLLCTCVCRFVNCFFKDNKATLCIPPAISTILVYTFVM